MKIKYLPLILASTSILIGSQANADVIWTADFESYNTSGGPVNVTLNSTGADDTFSSIAPNSRMSTAASQVASTGVPAFMSGNAFYLEGLVTQDGNASIRTLQPDLPSLGSDGLYVVSFDFFTSDSTNYSIIGETRAGSGRSGNTLYTASTNNTPLRITMVINHTDNSVALPSTLGTLNADSMVMYLYDGTTFSGAKFNDGNITSSSISGFSIGISRSNFDENDTPSAWYDNFAVWNSVSDTVGGTSVLELAPGTPIPEPSTYALILGATCLVGHLALRRRAQRQ